MDLLIECKLNAETAVIDGRNESVLALSALHTCPTKYGLGRATLLSIVRIAEMDGYEFVVGWAARDAVEFYRSCGWGVADNNITSQIDQLSKCAVWWSSRFPPSDGHNIVPLNKDW